MEFLHVTPSGVNVIQMTQRQLRLETILQLVGHPGPAARQLSMFNCRDIPTEQVLLYDAHQNPSIPMTLSYKGRAVYGSFVIVTMAHEEDLFYTGYSPTITNYLKNFLVAVQHEFEDPITMQELLRTTPWLNEVIVHDQLIRNFLITGSQQQADGCGLSNVQLLLQVIHALYQDRNRVQNSLTETSQPRPK